METENLRITKLKNYLTNIIKEIAEVRGINVDILPKEINNYSLNKIPEDSFLKRYIDGTEEHQDTYTLSSKRNYSYKETTNLSNIGFFEIFEKKIWNNNRKGDLPEIAGIKQIECLNCGTLNIADTNSAIFDIQIRITYNVYEEEIDKVSL